MRISDWSSDVCSSDLLHSMPPPSLATPAICWPSFFSRGGDQGTSWKPRPLSIIAKRPDVRVRRWRYTPVTCSPAADRSEEHTSQLQSLMRLSYAVFCLKTKRGRHTATHANDE